MGEVIEGFNDERTIYELSPGTWDALEAGRLTPEALREIETVQAALRLAAREPSAEALAWAREASDG